MPAPKKLRVASRIITKPTWSVASTTMLLNILGKIVLDHDPSVACSSYPSAGNIILGPHSKGFASG